MRSVVFIGSNLRADGEKSICAPFYLKRFRQRCENATQGLERRRHFDEFLNRNTIPLRTSSVFSCLAFIVGLLNAAHEPQLFHGCCRNVCFWAPLIVVWRILSRLTSKQRVTWSSPAGFRIGRWPFRNRRPSFHSPWCPAPTTMTWPSPWSFKKKWEDFSASIGRTRLANVNCWPRIYLKILVWLTSGRC